MWLFERACQRRPDGTPHHHHGRAPKRASWLWRGAIFISISVHVCFTWTFPSPSPLHLPPSRITIALFTHNILPDPSSPHHQQNNYLPLQLPNLAACSREAKISNNSRRKPHGCMWVGWDVCLWMMSAIKFCDAPIFVSMFFEVLEILRFWWQAITVFSQCGKNLRWQALWILHHGLLNLLSRTLGPCLFCFLCRKNWHE